MHKIANPSSNQNLNINGEKGSASALCMLISIVIILGAQEYWPLIKEKYDIKLIMLAGIVAGFFILVTIIIGFINILSGEKSPRQMKRIIIKERKKLNQTIQKYKANVEAIENGIRHTSSIMNPQGFQELMTTKGLITSLESRISKVNRLLATRDKEKIYYAYNTMFDDVSVLGDSIHGLILSDSDVVFSYDHIKKEFDNRISAISHYLPSVKIKRVRANTM